MTVEFENGRCCSLLQFAACVPPLSSQFATLECGA